MSKMFQVYGIGQALIPVLPPPLGFQTPPNSNQTNYEIGQLVYTPPLAPTSFYLYAGAGNWIEFATSSGDILSVIGTANQVSATTVSGNVTLSIPSTFIAPGSIAATTTLTATLGDITATNGNFVSTAAGKGIVLNSGTASGTTTATLNGRSGQITITTPSIAAAATFTFTITNSAVTASTTQILYSLTGGTTGAALTVQSVTNSSTQSVVVIQNGTGATTNTASLVLTFLVIN